LELEGETFGSYFIRFLPATSCKIYFFICHFFLCKWDLLSWQHKRELFLFSYRGHPVVLIKLKDDKTLSAINQTQQYIFILYLS